MAAIVISLDCISIGIVVKSIAIISDCVSMSILSNRLQSDRVSMDVDSGFNSGFDGWFDSGFDGCFHLAVLS